jgi:hypothetical protein
VVDARLGGEPHAEVRDESERGLQADHPAVGGRDADRAALVAAEGDVDLAGGQRGARFRRRAARRPLGVVRVDRPAVVAEEPVHHVLGDHLPAFRQHAGDDGGVHVGHEALHHAGRERLRDAGHADVVLEAHGLAGEEPGVAATDAAAPQPRQVRVLGRPRPVPGRPAREPQRRCRLLDAGHRELVELLQLLDHVRAHQLRARSTSWRASGAANMGVSSAGDGQPADVRSRDRRQRIATTRTR